MSPGAENQALSVALVRVIEPVSHWPISDQTLWFDAWNGAGPEGKDNVAVTWSARRRKIVEDAYGRFLAWLHAANPAHFALAPALRPAPDVVAAFVAAMRARGLASVSIAMTVGALSRMMQALFPSDDWSWLKRRYWRLKSRAKPSRNKRTRVVPSADLYTFGIHLMETATDRGRCKQPFFAASQYRDGLMIALLAARPLRIGNFQHLELGRSLIHRGRRYWLVFDEAETKTGRLIDIYVPDHLTPYLETYLRTVRPVLVGMRQPGGTGTAALWVSRSGEKMNEPAVRENINRRTRQAFGHSINPHLFRDCLATSFAIEDPENVRCISAILGHTTLSTAEKYYIQATMLTAARRFTSTMLEVRYKFMEIVNDAAMRDFLSASNGVGGQDAVVSPHGPATANPALQSDNDYDEYTIE